MTNYYRKGVKPISGCEQVPEHSLRRYQHDKDDIEDIDERDVNFQVIMGYGGLRGAVGFSLVLMIK